MADQSDRSSKDSPIVSVIMPVYNGASYIKEAVDSVFSQNVSLELLVVDDCSTDGTVEILKEYKDRSNFHFLQNVHNLGAGESRNKGLRAAKGKYIAFLDADDWWENGKLSEQLTLLETTGNVLCSTGRDLMNPDGSSTGKYIPVGSTITYRDLLHHNSINCSSVMVLREAILKYPMEHANDSHEDYLSWLKILKEYGPAIGINKPYLKYRLSEGGKSRNKWKSAMMTYRVYRYMGFSHIKSLLCFISYAIHGIWKYR